MKMNLFFRSRENGAAVFRLDVENRQRRLDMQQIATVNLRNGEVKVANNQEIAEHERSEIDAWMDARRTRITARENDQVERLIDTINETAHWAQGRATDDQIEAASDALLMAMHDLRNVIARRKSAILRDK